MLETVPALSMNAESFLNPNSKFSNANCTITGLTLFLGVHTKEYFEASSVL